MNGNYETKKEWIEIDNWSTLFAINKEQTKIKMWIHKREDGKPIGLISEINDLEKVNGNKFIIKDFQNKVDFPIYITDDKSTMYFPLLGS